jgi:hypothetical protein
MGIGHSLCVDIRIDFENLVEGVMKAYKDKKAWKSCAGILYIYQDSIGYEEADPLRMCPGHSRTRGRTSALSVPTPHISMTLRGVGKQCHTADYMRDVKLLPVVFSF